MLKEVFDKLANSYIDYIDSPNRKEISQLKTKIEDLESKLKQTSTYADDVQRAKAEKEELHIKESANHRKELCVSHEKYASFNLSTDSAEISFVSITFRKSHANYQA